MFPSWGRYLLKFDKMKMSSGHPNGSAATGKTGYFFEKNNDNVCDPDPSAQIIYFGYSKTLPLPSKA